MTIRVVLADDHALIRTGFKMILEAEDDIEVVGDASDGETGVVTTRRLLPDVVLMDIQMPTMDGLQATSRIVQEPSIRSRIVVLTTFERDDYIFDALRAGASGCLLKNSPAEELVHAVRIVAAGDALLAPSVTRPVIEGFIARPAHRSTESELWRLTEGETEVLQLLATVGAREPDASGHFRLRKRLIEPGQRRD